MSDSFASSSSAAAAGAASSSLLSKYTKLTSSIASTSQSIESTETQIANWMSAILELEESRREMEQDFSKAVEDTNALLKNKKTKQEKRGGSSTTTIAVLAKNTDKKEEENDLQNDDYNEEDEEAEYKRLALMEMELQQEIQMLEQDIKREKSEKEQQRQEFLSSCREFRRMVKRSRITLEGLKFQTGSAYIDQQEDEERMKVARERKRESEVALARAQEAISLLKEEKQRKDKESLNRVKNLQQQRAHLDKVRGEVVEMEREIHSLEQSTKEFEEISHGYAKGKPATLLLVLTTLVPVKILLPYGC